MDKEIQKILVTLERIESKIDEIDILKKKLKENEDFLDKLYS